MVPRERFFFLLENVVDTSMCPVTQQEELEYKALLKQRESQFPVEKELLEANAQNPPSPSKGNGIWERPRAGSLLRLR
jgi:hypothetical protein